MTWKIHLGEVPLTNYFYTTRQTHTRRIKKTKYRTLSNSYNLQLILTQYRRGCCVSFSCRCLNKLAVNSTHVLYTSLHPIHGTTCCSLIEENCSHFFSVKYPYSYCYIEAWSQLSNTKVSIDQNELVSSAKLRTVLSFYPQTLIWTFFNAWRQIC